MRLFVFMLILAPVCWSGAARAGDDTGSRVIGRVVQIASSDKNIQLSWVNPTDEDFAGVRIQRGTAGFPATSADGTNVYDGTAESHLDTGLESGTLYYYTAFTYDGSTNYSAGVGAGAKTSGPHYYWVDFLYGEGGIGTQTDPFNTLDEGVTAAEANDVVVLKAGSTATSANISKALRLESYGGTARIGAAP